MNRIAGLAVLFLLSSVFSSCSFYKVVSGKRKKDPDKKVVWTGADTARAATAMPATDTVVPVAVAKPVNPLIEQYRPIWEKRLNYTTFSGKAKMQFEGPDSKVEFTGHIRLKRDSAIWVNITAIGGIVRAACIFITPDSFFMVNYQQDQVTILPLSQADKFLPAKVDFASLQNLIIGEPLRQGTIVDAIGGGDSIVLHVEDTSYLESVMYNKVDSTLRLARLRTRKPGGPTAQTDYSDYITSSNRRVSTGRVINLMNGKDQYTLYMNFTKAEFDEPVTFPFNIPKNYKIKP